MKLSTFLISTIFIISLTACGGGRPPLKFWKKPETSLQVSKNAHSKCKYDVGMNKVSKGAQTEMVDNCMKMQGFRMGKYYRY